MAEAWHLPGWTETSTARHRGSGASGAAFETPALDALQATAVAERVREATLEARRTYGISEVATAIDGVARRLMEGSPARDQAVALMGESLGWPSGLVRETLDAARQSWTLDALNRLLHAELQNPRALDGFVADDADDSRVRRALGHPLLLQVLSSNVPGVGVTAIIRGLLARSGVLCKAASDEPFLPALFARLLSEEVPLLGQTIAVSWWPSEPVSAEWSAWSRRSDLAVVYGGPDAVEAVRAALPSGTELLVYGPRVGIGVVLDHADRDLEAARRLARDVCAYEQQGCVSPRLVFVVGGDVEAFAALLARGLEEETERQPPPELAAAEAIAIRNLRAEREFDRKATGSLLASEPDLRWTVLVDTEPRLETTSLPRVVQLCTTPDVGDLLTALESLSGHIQAVGYAGEADIEELAEGVARLGVSRMAPFGRVAWPPVDWRHDGRHQLLPLLRWTDWERA